MAGNRIDMIERAAARLRQAAPQEKKIAAEGLGPAVKTAVPQQQARAPADLTPTLPPRPAVAPFEAKTILADMPKPPGLQQSQLSSFKPILARPVAAKPEAPKDLPKEPVQPDPPLSAVSEPVAEPPSEPSKDLATPDSAIALADIAAKDLAPAQLSEDLTVTQTLSSAIPGALVEDTTPGVPAARHSRTVVLDTARLALAGTIDWSSDRTPVMEELRLIKRRLLRRAFNSANGPDSISHLVMVTSSKPREGKTFTSTNIAISISLEEDYNVLLVDADIRRQALRQNLGLEANQGFVDLLLDPSLDMSDVLLRTNIPRLSVLPAGTMSDRAPELLASSRMRDLIDDMAKRYKDRIILFDTAPCLVSSDAATLAAHVGQVVFVIEAEQTQQHEIIAALNLISACPDISLVLNKAQPLATTSYGGYGAY
jgi:exopolysaccharide/PEP-CTERM locus tyrosine autokinase